MASPSNPAVPSSSTQDGAADPFDVARQIVLRQLAMAPRSRAQLAAALAKRSCPPHVAVAVLDRMTEVGLVDDAAYAQMVVRSQQASRGLSRIAVARELRAKGIDDELVDDTVSAITDDQDRERARSLVNRRMRSMHGLAAPVQARRLAGMLARKGYPPGLAWSVIRDAVTDAPEHQRD